MDTTRQSKINRLLQKELSEIFLRFAQSGNGLLISVSNVRISPDLSIARVYLSIFPTEQRDSVLKSVQENTKAIRHELAGKVRFQLRKIPDLTFFADDTLDYAQNIDNLLNTLK